MIISSHKLRIYSPKLCNKELCTGCLSCYNICESGAIQYVYDDEGFVYPEILVDKCIGCGRCGRVCPILTSSHKNVIADMAYAAWSNDNSIVGGSSSGGCFSIIARNVLNKGGVVFGVFFDDDWDCYHSHCTSVEELPKLRGSKYVQSFVGRTFQEVKDYLAIGKIVLYSGTPCQISGLKSYLSQKKCNVSNLITIDLVCHGVPSPIVFKSYLKYLEDTYQSKLKAFSFRDKKWSWLRYNCVATFSNGKKYFGKWEQDPYMRGFLREYYLRSSCHCCRFATKERCGDITLCDYWGYNKKSGEIDNKDRGVSLILLNTSKGKSFFGEIRSSIICYERDVQESMKSNRAFYDCFPVSPLRDQFWKDFRKKGFGGVISKYLYPEEISPKFDIIYRYGRVLGAIIGKIIGVKYRIVGKIYQQKVFLLTQYNKFTS